MTMRVTPDDTPGSPQIQGDGHLDGHSVDQTGESSRRPCSKHCSPVPGPISESAAPVDRESCSYAGPYRISYPLSVTLPPPVDTIPKGALSQASGLSNF